MIIKWIYPVISVLVISVALLVYEINRLDDQYTELIESETTQLKMVQQLTFNSNRRHILLFYIAHCEDSVQIRKMEIERGILIKENDSIFNTLVKINSANPDQIQIIKDAVEARRVYNLKSQEYQAKIETSSKPFLSYEMSRDLDNLFTTYQNSINELYNEKNKHVLIRSNSYTSAVEQRSLWISLFSVSPFLIFGVLLIVLLFLLRFVLVRASER